MSVQEYIDEEADLSDEMRALAEGLARGECDMIVRHGRDHIAFYNKAKDVWPMHFRTIDEHGGRVAYGGRKALPDPEARNVVFARYDAEAGKERGWLEVKID